MESIILASVLIVSAFGAVAISMLVIATEP
jgi:hypothetical protein